MLITNRTLLVICLTCYVDIITSTKRYKTKNNTLEPLTKKFNKQVYSLQNYKSNVLSTVSWLEPVLTPALDTGIAKSGNLFTVSLGAGIALWLEHWTRDWKVAGSNPCWNGGRIFFFRVDFLCWLLFWYPFHPRVTTVARKRPRSFCQKCRWQVTSKHAYTLRMWLLLNQASALVTTCP